EFERLLLRCRALGIAASRVSQDSWRPDMADRRRICGGRGGGCKQRLSMRQFTRRTFLMGSTAMAGTLAVRADARAATRRRPTDEKVTLAVVGAGGRGADNLEDLKATGVNVVALCDCDHRRAAETFTRYPNARRYSDWRRLLDGEKAIDAVLVATPDHNHA